MNRAAQTDTTVDNLATFLNRTSGGMIECSVASYNQVTQTLMSPAKAANLLLWTCPDLQLRAFKRLLGFERFEAEDN